MVDAVDPSISRTATCEIIVGEGEEGATWSVIARREYLCPVLWTRKAPSALHVRRQDGCFQLPDGPGDQCRRFPQRSHTFVSREDEEVTDSYDLIGAKVNHVDTTANQMTLNFTKTAPLTASLCAFMTTAA
ncbi:MAG: hypothetical protein ACLS8R_10495 [Anaeromassilibacillus sp.]